MSDIHDKNSPVAVAFRKASGALDGLIIDDCRDLVVALMASVIMSEYRQAGMPLELALECADAAIEDVKENLRINWKRVSDQ